MPAPSAAPEPGSSTLRERYRAQVRQEVKQAALRQLGESGPGGVSVSAIGKELGVSGPALYRYFASRDELLTELVIDAYHDLADALAATVRGPDREPRARLDALVRAYRSWALAQPHRYQLLFGPPLPGYDAHAQRLVEAAQAVMNLLLETLPRPRERNGHRPAGPAAGIPAPGLGAPARPGHRPRDRAARRPDLEQPARLRQPRNRRELRIDGHRPRPALRNPADDACSMSYAPTGKPRWPGTAVRSADLREALGEGAQPPRSLLRDQEQLSGPDTGVQAPAIPLFSRWT